MSDATDRDDRVSRRAYELWEQEGGEHGRHEDHWHRAAAELDSDEQVSIAAPDGTTLIVPADEVEGKPVRKRAAKSAAAKPAAKPAAKKIPAGDAQAGKAPAKPHKAK